MKIEDVLNAYPSRLGEVEVTDSDKLRDLREWADTAASTLRDAANEIASKELARERAQREANEASGIARERGKKLIAVEGTLRNAGVPMDDRTHDEGVAWLVTKCEQLCRMHDGVSADLDRERREHQEAMAEVAARELKLTEERDELSARYNRVMDETQVKAETRVFSVVLKSAGPYKISVIKAIREVTGLGLKDAKDLMDGAPSEVLNGWNEDEARSAIDRLSAVGADVELKSEVPDPDRVAMRQRELHDIEKQRNAFMLQRDAAIQDAKFFKSEAEKAVADLAEVSAALDKAGVPRSVDSMGNVITPAGRVAVLLALHDRIAPPKRRSKTKPTKKPKVAAKRSRRKP